MLQKQANQIQKPKPYDFSYRVNKNTALTVNKHIQAQTSKKLADFTHAFT